MTTFRNRPPAVWLTLLLIVPVAAVGGFKSRAGGSPAFEFKSASDSDVQLFKMRLFSRIRG